MLSLARSHKLAPRKRHVLPPGFWSKVDKSGGEGSCWLWVRGKTNGGYGKFKRGGKMYYAHRVALQWATQKSGRRRLATHGTCHARACVNPAHLDWQTYKGNAADKVRDGTLIRGERHGRSKLTEGQVLDIRNDPRTCLQLAAAYGVSDANVRHIKNRHRWAWLE